MKIGGNLKSGNLSKRKWRTLGKVLVGIGVWIISDGILSWTLYANAPDHRGNKRQTFKKDHWVRLVRIILGVVLVVIGSMV